MRKLSRNLMLAAPICSAALMLGALVQNLMLPSAVDARPYHRRVAEIERGLPIEVPGWDAQLMEIPEGSVELLRPNAARAVQYINADDGTTCQFLLIQCRDARDLAGHYPPRCYPNVYGYIEKARTAYDWEAGGLTISGVEYTFAQSAEPGSPRWVVMHFFVLPSGVTTGNLSTMREAAGDYLRRHEGAAQVQLLFNEAAATTGQRRRAFEQIVGAQAALIRAILDRPENDSNPPAPVTADAAATP